MSSWTWPCTADLSWPITLTTRPCALSLTTSIRLQSSGLIAIYRKSICLNWKIGTRVRSNADFYNRFYEIYPKNDINVCIVILHQITSCSLLVTLKRKSLEACLCQGCSFVLSSWVLCVIRNVLIFNVLLYYRRSFLPTYIGLFFWYSDSYKTRFCPLVFLCSLDIQRVNPLSKGMLRSWGRMHIWLLNLHQLLADFLDCLHTCLSQHLLPWKGIWS